MSIVLPLESIGKRKNIPIRHWVYMEFLQEVLHYKITIESA